MSNKNNTSKNVEKEIAAIRKCRKIVDIIACEIACILIVLALDYFLFLKNYIGQSRLNTIIAISMAVLSIVIFVIRYIISKKSIDREHELTRKKNSPPKSIPVYTAPKKQTSNDEEEQTHEQTLKLMSPMQMVIRRFFRSKLSIIGLVMIVALFLFCWVGPLVYRVSPTEIDKSGKVEYTETYVEYTDENGEVHGFWQVIETNLTDNMLSAPSAKHPLGTDKTGKDVLARLMNGGKISLGISFMAVFIVTFLGIIFGGIAGYFGGAVDNIIMRICDILMCLPGFPILLIVGTIIDGLREGGMAMFDYQYKIYWLMGFLTLISWSGTARLVRGQILSLREQEFMTAAEATGVRTRNKIFKHLIPNVIPQLIVTCTMGLGSTIITESTLSFLGLGVKFPFASWGNIINDVNDTYVLTTYWFIWIPAGVCLLLTVLAFNILGDGLRDAFDPKMKR